MAPGWRAPVFAEYMGSAPVLDYARGFLGCGREELMLPDADCILYLSPMNVDRAQGWHRDSTHWGAADHPSGSAWSEAAQREQWARICARHVHGFDVGVPGSGALFGGSTYQG